MHDACAVMLHCEKAWAAAIKKEFLTVPCGFTQRVQVPKVRKGPQEQQDVEKGAKPKGQLSHIT